ncbi:sensor histidine kinase [Mucilaginibacter endophyticus]|uniref:sensor histidine kinase n=1 Tax=Mucilaginibacter endophyticus TaxID=2675003 RepID=UPI000E0DF2B8|nr:HAMP domain-containing sensor histidine kinase [Mucilaginibacter endophyticus]
MKINNIETTLEAIRTLGAAHLVHNSLNKEVAGTEATGNHSAEAIQILGHELKTPLSLIKIYLQMAQRLSNGNSDQVSGILEKANVQVDAISRMTDDFVQKFRCPQSGRSLTFHQFDLVDLIRELLLEADQLYPEFVIEFNGSESVVVKAERHRIKQVLNNLLSNAVKYSGGLKDISIYCIRSSEDVIVAVRDFGIGIEPSLCERIFQKAFRPDTLAVQNIEGSGLGLFIVKEIIDEHGGRVGVSSVVGEGSHFFFSLPVIY